MVINICVCQWKFMYSPYNVAVHLCARHCETFLTPKCPNFNVPHEQNLNRGALLLSHSLNAYSKGLMGQWVTN